MKWDKLKQDISLTVRENKEPPNPLFVQRHLESLTKRKGNGSWFIVCPFHSDKDPSLSVIVVNNHSLQCGFWKCFGCGKEGHWDELALALNLPTTDPLQSDLYESDAFKVSEDVEDIDDLPSFNTDILDPISDNQNWRGFSGKFLRKYNTYFDEYDNFYKIVFLCRRRNNRKIVGYIRCRIEKKENQLSYINAPGDWVSKYWLFEDKLLITKKVVIVEGPRDALAWNRIGIPTIGLIGTQTGAKQCRINTLLGAGVEEVILFLDNDEAAMIAVEGKENKIGLRKTLNQDFKVKVFPTWEKYNKKKYGKKDPFELAKDSKFVKQFRSNL
jgi:hypothetical protein